MRKRKRNKNLKCILSILLLLITSCFLAACGVEEENRNPYNFGVQEATSDFYVNDFASIFDASQKETLMKNAVALAEEYSGVQVVVTTIESFDKTVIEWSGTKPEQFEIEEVAYAMFDQYGIGKDDMGILILFSVGDREVRIETGRQMQNYITDSASGQLLDDYGMDYFVDDKFAEGLVSVQTATIDKIKERVPKNWNVDSKEEAEENEESEKAAVVDDTNTPSNTKKDSSKDKNSGNGLLAGLIMFIGAFIAAIIAFIRKIFTSKAKLEEQEKKRLSDLNELKEQCNNRISEIRVEHESKMADLKNAKEAELTAVRRKLAEEEKKSASLSSELELLKDKYARIQTLHPEIDFETEIQEMIESEFKEEAARIDEKLQIALGYGADKDNIDIFKDAIELYNKAEENVRKYIVSDIQQIKSLLNDSISLKEEYERIEQEKKDKAYANQVHQEIVGVMTQNSVANRLTYEVLNGAYKKYQHLTAAQRGFFGDENLIVNLKRQVSIAKEDYDNYKSAQEAEAEVRSIVDRIYSADEDDRDRLRRAKGYYTNLTSAEQAYFSDDLLSKLNSLISDAEKDHRREEEARRRRRMQSTSSSYRSSSNFGSRPGGYGGFGGRPGASGASRKF